jgi:hypothetical protein
MFHNVDKLPNMLITIVKNHISLPFSIVPRHRFFSSPATFLPISAKMTIFVEQKQKKLADNEFYICQSLG